MSSPAPERVERAERPTGISARGWVEILGATVLATLKHRVPATAAGATFYLGVAALPAIAAFGSLYGAVSDPETLRRGLEAFTGMTPPGLLDLVGAEALRFAHGRPERLLGAAAGYALIALVSATSGVRVLMTGLNTAFQADESRPWVVRRLLATGFALAAAAGLSLQVALVVRSGSVVREQQLAWAVLRLLGRWGLLFALSALTLTLLYRYGADRSRARWRWVTPGSLAAAAVGLATAAAMSVYLARFAQYERTYGGLGSLLGLGLWLWSGMIVVLAGAELNQAIEVKTSVDTCVTGRPEEEPPRERSAALAA